MNKLKWLLKVSRPRFWPYLFGPYLIGIVAAGPATSTSTKLLLGAMGVYFTFSANLLIYGINDVYDYETDKNNPKKQGYEALVNPRQHNFLASAIAVTNFPFLLPFLFWSSIALPARIAAALFIFFGVAYSAPPIRAKARPVIDTLFNSLYVFPALVSYGLVTNSWPSPQLFAAAVLWCMAMHAYSAVPDIKADKKAGLSTIATLLGARGTLLFCFVCYMAATALSYGALGWFSVLFGTIYMAMMVRSLTLPTRDNVFKLYKWFPTLNLAVGFSLFWWVYLVVK